MFKRKILKVLALVLVMNILIIPLTSFCAQEQNKYKVIAAEGVVDPQFYAAILTMIGITSVMIGSMSDNFSIPEADFTALKDQFTQTLEADAAKKSAWMQAQSDYLAGGVAKTMGAVELAKIGINDIYDQFKTYLQTKYYSITDPMETENIIGFTDQYNMVKTVNTSIPSVYFRTAFNASTGLPRDFSDYSQTYDDGRYLYVLIASDSSNVFRQNYRHMDIYFIKDGVIDALAPSLVVSTYYGTGKLGFSLTINPILYPNESALLLNYISSLGIVMTGNLADLPLIKGTVNDVNNIVNVDDQYIHVFPTIPWVDPTIPIGTIVTPAIAAPYAGTVPIDVPITAPIDPPIDEPTDPPVIDNIAGTVAAILAGLTPIAGFLEYILAGQVSLTDTIEAGITGVIDGIGDIAGTITGGITSTLTDIQTAINDMVNPSPENVEKLNLDPIKNIPAVLFSRFPFSIPFDFYNIIAYMGGSAREAPEFNFTVPLSSIGQEDVVKAIDMGPFDQIAGYIRIAELIAFAIAVMLKTKTLIWG